MKKILFSVLTLFFGINTVLAQMPILKTETANYNPINTFPTIQSNSQNAMTINTSDTLRYFLNKHFYRNPSSGTPAPNNQYFTLLNPYPNNALVISHCGGVFKNSSPITITGLEGIVTLRANAVSASVTVKLYLCNVTGANLPIFPALDSVTAISSTLTNGAWIGANFTTPVNLNGNFAVLYRNDATTAGDTLGLFINNACTPASTCTAVRKFGEGLGVMRVNGNFQTNTGAFGAGTDYEFIVAPRVQFAYSAGVTALTSTACLNSFGQFVNASTPMNLVENRQFNFNKFAAVWGALSNTLLPVTDSIYNWTFSGSPTGPLTTKDAIAIFNMNGIQTASLAVKYNKSRAGGLLPSVEDVATATINISNANTPTVSMSGNTLICSGSSSTLTATGSATYNWGGPQFNNSVTIVSPTATSVYTCVANNGVCVGYYTYTVNVASSPTLVITGPSLGCIGGNALLTVSGANTYSWSTGSTSYSTSISNSVIGVQTYTAYGTSAPCAEVSAIKNVTVNALPIVSLAAPVSTICSTATGGSTVQLNGSPSGGQYSGTFVNNSGVFTPNAVTTATLNYNYTDPSTQCSNSATTSISVVACQATTSISENSLNNRMEIYPNPSSNGSFEVSNLLGENLIQVYSSLGALVLEVSCSTESLKIDLLEHANGIYFVNIKSANGSSKTFKAVIQKQ